MSKILLIDDEGPVREVLALSLRSDGHEVLTACDGQNGVEVFRQERPPIVLTDIRMPGIDGIEVLKKVKEIDPEAEVIVITGYGEMDVAIRALQLDASDFITKPISDEALSIALQRAREKLDIRLRLKDYTDNLEKRVKEATGELRTAHDFQKRLIQSSIDGVIAADQDRTVVVFNQGAENLLGYAAEEVIGRMKMDAVYPAGVAEIIRKELEGDAHGGRGRLVDYENRVISKKGEQIPVRISGAAIVDDGAAAGVVFFLQDLREIQRLQRELIENERLSATGQAVAGMAHHIKNILNGLQGGVYIVNTSMKKNKPDLLPKGWSMVESNIGKISDLVMNMLVYSKEREPEYELCRPNDIAAEVYDLMKERAAQSNVRLEKAFDHSIGECYLDPGGIQRCLLNLVANAIDACIFDPAEDKDWSVLMRTAKGEDGIRFYVSDNGAGMTEEVKKRLFERFFSTKGGKGTGLGLLVTRKTVEEHGGEISVESSPGRGATFIVHLPCRAGNAGGRPGPAGRNAL